MNHLQLFSTSKQPRGSIIFCDDFFRDFQFASTILIKSALNYYNKLLYLYYFKYL